MADSAPSRDLTRTTLAVLSLAALVLASFLILKPFLPALIWATVIAVACWPVMCSLQQRFGDRRGPAVAVMMGGVLVVFLVPLGLLVTALVRGAPAATAWVLRVLREGVPPPPAWVADLPLVGSSLSEQWAHLADKGPEGVAAQLRPHLEELARWFAAQAGGAGMLLLEFALTLLLTGLLFARGERFGSLVRSFARRLAGERGERATTIAGQSIRAVAFGVVVTAIVQALAGGVGLWIAGVPAAWLLAAVMLFTGIAQLGAAPVVALASIWLFAQDSIGWGIAVLVWAVIVGSLDNVLRPMLIKRGVDLPLLLVFAGVIGGLIAFGVVGLIAGPVVLAVAFPLLGAWIKETPAPVEAAS